MELTNDNGCSWIKDLTPRTNIKTLQSNDDSEWLIIGAGYTGLSAARKLGQLYPNQKIIIVDAQLAGEGASSRNSGYLVDTTLNDGFTSNKELDNYKKKLIFMNLVSMLLKNSLMTIKLTVTGMNVVNILHHQELKIKKFYLIFQKHFLN